MTRLEGSPVLGRETPYDGAAGGGKGRGETSRGPSKVAPQVGRRCGEVPLPTQGRTSPNWLWEARGRGWGADGLVRAQLGVLKIYLWLWGHGRAESWHSGESAEEGCQRGGTLTLPWVNVQSKLPQMTRGNSGKGRSLSHSKPGCPLGSPLPSSPAQLPAFPGGARAWEVRGCSSGAEEGQESRNLLPSQWSSDAGPGTTTGYTGLLTSWCCGPFKK